MKADMQLYSKRKSRRASSTQPGRRGGLLLRQAFRAILFVIALTQLRDVKAAFKGEDLYSGLITPEPKEVSQENAKLSVLVEPKTAIPVGAHVELKLPTSGEVSFTAASITTAPKCDLVGLSTPEVVLCKVEQVGGRH